MQDGGSSRQRRSEKRIEDRIQKAVVSQLTGLSTAGTPLVTKESPEKVSTGTKLQALWNSTSAWAGIGIVVGVIAGQISFNLLFVVVWAIVYVEVLRARFFNRRIAKILGNLLLGMFLAVAFLGLWRVSPKPKEPATLDQGLEAFGKKFPWLSNPPQPVSIRLPKETTMDFLSWSLVQPVLRPNLPTVARVMCHNGENIARKSFCSATLKVVSLAAPLSVSLYNKKPFAVLEKGEEAAFNEFRRQWIKEMPLNEIDRPARHQQAIDAASAPLNADDIAGLSQETKILYVFGAAKWTDDAGTWESDLCSYWVVHAVTAPDKPYMWMNCVSGKHNDPKQEFKP